MRSRGGRSKEHGEMDVGILVRTVWGKVADSAVCIAHCYYPSVNDSIITGIFPAVANILRLGSTQYGLSEAARQYSHFWTLRK
jgi:hypothetical protein